MALLRALTMALIDASSILVSITGAKVGSSPLELHLDVTHRLCLCSRAEGVLGIVENVEFRQVRGGESPYERIDWSVAEVQRMELPFDRDPGLAPHRRVALGGLEMFEGERRGTAQVLTLEDVLDFLGRKSVPLESARSFTILPISLCMSFGTWKP